MYRLIQLALLWYRVLTGFLKENGFIANPIDLCVMNTTRNGKQITVVIYVDNLLVFAEEQDSLLWFYELLDNRFDNASHEIKDEISYLGMVITRTPRVGFKVSMEAYTKDILQFYGKANLRNYLVPAAPDLFDQDAKKTKANRGSEEVSFDGGKDLVYGKANKGRNIVSNTDVMYESEEPEHRRCAEARTNLRIFAVDKIEGTFY